MWTVSAGAGARRHALPGLGDSRLSGGPDVGASIERANGSVAQTVRGVLKGTVTAGLERASFASGGGSMKIVGAALVTAIR